MNLIAINKVSLAEESCDKITLKVSYTNNKSYDGYLRLHTSSKPYVEGVRGGNMKILSKGTSEATNTQWITKDITEAKTTELWITFEKILDNKYDGEAIRIKIPFEKTWNHNCK